MAEFYVRDDGSDTDPYDTWANAATKLDDLTTGNIAGQSTVPGDGDIVYVDSNYDDGTSGNRTIGTSSDMILTVISVDSTGDPEPPTAGDYLRGATIQSTNADVVLQVGNTSGHGAGIFLGMVFKAYGSIRAPSGSFAYAQDCECHKTGTSGGLFRLFGGYLELMDCDYYMGGTAVYLAYASTYGGMLKIIGGGAVAGTSAANTLLYRMGGPVIVRDLDASSLLGSGKDLITINPYAEADFKFSGVKLPASWDLFDATSSSQYHHTFEGYNLGAADTLIAFHTEHSNVGSAVQNTTTYLDSAFSVQMDCQAAAKAGALPFRQKLCDIDSGSAGATVTVELVFDSNDASDLTDAEFWIEVEYPNSSIGAYRERASTLSADRFLSASNLASSSASWTGTGGFTGSAVVRKASVTLSGDQAGIVSVFACLAYGADMTVYIEPVVTLS